jgi:multimeric flavodoxin WrbA
MKFQGNKGMAPSAALVIGTSRHDGNTWSILRAANERLNLPVFDLSSLRISYFDYTAANLDDDFIPTIERLLEYESIGLVSPVYWYSVSAQMKTFIDRPIDLLGPRKDLGRKLRGKRLFLMAKGSTETSLPECTEQMIRLTAEYLGMKYEGAHYSHVEHDVASNAQIGQHAKQFLESKVSAPPRA